MEIEASIAQEIVEKLNKVVLQDLNFMNSKSIIIASTDKSRIGTYHEGAEITKNTRKELVINFDNEYDGSKQGINLPILFQEDVVGTIGITGEKSKVIVYGEIIKEMTEILIYQNYISKNNQLRYEVKRQIVHELLFSKSFDVETLNNNCNLINLDVTKHNIVGVIKLKLNQENVDESVKQRKFNQAYTEINRIVPIEDKVFSILINNEIIFMFNNDDIIDVMFYYKNYMDGNKTLDYKLTLGSIKNDVQQLRESYKEALIVQNLIKDNEQLKVLKYKEENVDVLLYEIPKNKKEKFMNSIFKNMPENKMNEYLETLQLYFDNNNSIEKTADMLFVHKNTVQYRLKKIKELTKFNPQKTKDSFVLQVALRMYYYV